jgi:GT2 family glycosyltransferase
VDVLSGCFLVFPRHVLETVGEFDEDFFMYVEDVDWCVRVREAGFEVHYVPEWSVVHERGHGGANESLTPMDGAGNLELYFRKHRVPHSPRALRWLRRAHYFIRSVWLLYRAATGRSGALTEARRAWITLVMSFGRAPAAPGG